MEAPKKSTSALLMSSAAASRSRAKTSPSPDEAPDLPASVRGCGGTWHEPLAWLSPDGLSWRTWQRCLVEGWTVFSQTFPRSGLMRNGIAYQRPPLVRLTDATGCGLLPTPEASNTKAVALRTNGREPRDFTKPIPTPTVNGNYNRVGLTASSGDGLATWVAKNTVPTPRPCSGLRSSGANRTEIMRALETWPTPRASDGDKNRRTPEGAAREVARGKSPDLGATVGGALNPTWVEWLMGFPLGWTDLEPSETQSCLRFPNSSDAQS